MEEQLCGLLDAIVESIQNYYPKHRFDETELAAFYAAFNRVSLEEKERRYQRSGGSVAC